MGTPNSLRYPSTHSQHITSSPLVATVVNPSQRYGSAFFDRLPHAKIKNRNRLFLSEMVSGTGWGWRFSPDEAYTIGAKACAKMVNSGLGVACLEIWFQNRSVDLSAVPCRIGRAARGRTTILYHPQRKALTGQNKRTLRRPCRKRFTTSNSSGADRYAGKQRAEISRPCASFSIIPPSPPSVNSPLRSEYDHAIMTA